MEQTAVGRPAAVDETRRRFYEIYRDPTDVTFDPGHKLGHGLATRVGIGLPGAGMFPRLIRS